jgi:hypothetical protein
LSHRTSFMRQVRKQSLIMQHCFAQFFHAHVFVVVAFCNLVREPVALRTAGRTTETSATRFRNRRPHTRERSSTPARAMQQHSYPGHVAVHSFADANILSYEFSLTTRPKRSFHYKRNALSCSNRLPEVACCSSLLLSPF